MPDNIDTWVEQCVAAKLERLRAGSDLTHELLRRSYEQIAKSIELLGAEVPKVWHPSRPDVLSLIPNQSDAQGFTHITGIGSVRRRRWLRDQ